MAITKYLIIKVLPDALSQANTLAVQLGDSPEGVDSFGLHNAYNASGDSADLVEAYILRVAVYPAKGKAVDEAIEGIEGIERVATWEAATDGLQKVNEIVP